MPGAAARTAHMLLPHVQTSEAAGGAVTGAKVPQPFVDAVLTSTCEHNCSDYDYGGSAGYTCATCRVPRAPACTPAQQRARAPSCAGVLLLGCHAWQPLSRCEQPQPGNSSSAGVWPPCMPGHTGLTTSPWQPVPGAQRLPCAGQRKPTATMRCSSWTAQPRPSRWLWATTTPCPCKASPVCMLWAGCAPGRRAQQLQGSRAQLGARTCGSSRP